MKNDFVCSQTRRRPRLPANDRVIIGDDEAGWTINWSPTGACVVAEEVMQCGDRVAITFPERYARGEAKVVWTQVFPDGCLAGLEFLSLNRRAVSLR